MSFEDPYSNESNEFNRPRRPNPDTVTYLKSLPLNGDEADEHQIDPLTEIQQFASAASSTSTSDGSAINEDADFPPILAAALQALDEVQMEIASLAGDEGAALALEELVKLTAPFSVSASCVWLSACANYVHHLSMHRYGSHVLQTILEQVFASNSTSSNRDQDIALHPQAPTTSFASEDEGNTSEKLLDLLFQWHQELVAVGSQLTKHLTATHILRTLFLAMGGIHYSTSGHRAGKQTKNLKYKNAQQQQQQQVLTLRSTNIQVEKNERFHFPGSKRMDILKEWVDVVAPDTGMATPGPLQQLACHASGGPLLIALLRALTYLDNEQSASTSTGTVTTPQHYHLQKIQEEPQFAMDSTASVLSKRILCWSSDDNASSTPDDQETSVMSNVLYGMAGETRGSHVLDVLLKTCPDEMYERIIVEGQFHKENSLKEYVEHDVSNFVVQTILATTRSETQAIAAAKVCAPLISSGLVVDASRRRRGILWRLAELALQYKTIQASLLSNLEKFVSLDKASSALLGARLEGERIQVNVEGTRALHYLLQFDKGQPLLQGLIDNVSTDEFVLMAQDGLSSTCIWNVIAEEPRKKSFVKARIALLKKLEGRWITLATHRIGHHIVLNVFASFWDVQLRQQLVDELSRQLNRLRGSAMGRAVLSKCAVELYKRNKKEWNKVMTKQIQDDKWRLEMEQQKSSKKHKRVSGGGAGEGSTLRKKKSKSSVDNIFEALTIPAEKR